MLSILSVICVLYVIWRAHGFYSAYQRAKARPAELKAEKEQKELWERSMRGRSEGNK